MTVYLSFFPHLIAGPIVRGTELLPQIRTMRDPRDVHYVEAFWLIAAGLAKKVVLSSYLSTYVVDPVFADPHQHSALEVLFAIWGYAVQIYADFSGYTDIAIGLALLMGFRFPVNFRARTRPSTSRTSGAGGTSPCRSGCATTSTSRSAATGGASGASRSTSW